MVFILDFYSNFLLVSFENLRSMRNTNSVFIFWVIVILLIGIKGCSVYNNSFTISEFKTNIIDTVKKVNKKINNNNI